MSEPARWRPVLRPGQDGVPADASEGPEGRRESAQQIAERLLARARAAGPDGFPIEDLEELTAGWAGAEPSALPAQLRALVELHAETARHPAQTARVLAAGRGAPAVADVVAGLPELLDEVRVLQATETILRRGLAVDLSDGLLRAAALLRVAAAGRRQLARPGSEGEPLRARADQDLLQAVALEVVARRSALRRE